MTWLLLAFLLAFYAIPQLPRFVHLFVCLSFYPSVCPSSYHPSVRPSSHSSITKIDFQAIVIQEFSIVNSMVLRDCFNFQFFILSCLSEVGFEWSDTRNVVDELVSFSFSSVFFRIFALPAEQARRDSFLLSRKSEYKLHFARHGHGVDMGRGAWGMECET